MDKRRNRLTAIVLGIALGLSVYAAFRPVEPVPDRATMLANVRVCTVMNADGSHIDGLCW